ncbi:hypothetical protein PoB_003387000 [Plakobranchus ocellatus]|uniref:Uncharacterized protein n=1 Tax=Plakobranchus ocellatus TaxID=259542 RepID=A0AAV4AKI7_9GAST|nr:hypothetical protein PoB_003387000 [Plakobranchus ocellatus]
MLVCLHRIATHAASIRNSSPLSLSSLPPLSYPSNYCRDTTLQCPCPPPVMIITVLTLLISAMFLTALADGVRELSDARHPAIPPALHSVTGQQKISRMSVWVREKKERGVTGEEVGRSVN